jgi:hypothetical protein
MGLAVLLREVLHHGVQKVLLPSLRLVVKQIRSISRLLVADKLTPAGCGDLLCAAVVVVVGFADRPCQEACGTVMAVGGGQTVLKSFNKFTCAALIAQSTVVLYRLTVNSYRTLVPYQEHEQQFCSTRLRTKLLKDRSCLWPKSMPK